MLMPSESQIERIGNYEVVNPTGLRSIAEFQLRVELTRLRLARAGIPIGDAIEAALRRA